MISEIRGKVIRNSDSRVVVDVNGVGFEVQVGAGKGCAFVTGSDVRLLTRLMFKEDGPVLYGFLSEEERTVFDLLMTVRGIGPKQALNVASFFEPAEFYRAVLSRNEAALARCPGIGKKTASRIIMELRDRVGAGDIPRVELGPGEVDVWEDALEGLTSLGYTREEVEPVLKVVREEVGPADLETILTEALKRIARRR